MKYLLKLIVVPMVYLLCFAFSTVGIASISGFNELTKCIICAFFLLFYIFLVAIVMIKEGHDAYDILLRNNTQRRHMVETGVVVDFDTQKEYSVWKGFTIGLICCIPLVIMVVVHLLLAPRGETSSVSIFCEMFYGVFFSVARTYKNANEMGFFIGSAFVVVALPLITGVPFMLGASRRRKQQERVRQLNKELHGEDR